MVFGIKEFNDNEKKSIESIFQQLEKEVKNKEISLNVYDNHGQFHLNLMEKAYFMQIFTDAIKEYMETSLFYRIFHQEEPIVQYKTFLSTLDLEEKKKTKVQFAYNIFLTIEGLHYLFQAFPKSIILHMILLEIHFEELNSKKLSLNEKENVKIRYETYKKLLQINLKKEKANFVSML